jgi:hypothetical protein
MAFSFWRDYYGNQKYQYAYYDAGIGNVEGRPPVKPQKTVKLYADKIHHPVGPEDAVYQIPHPASDNAGDGPPLQAGQLIGLKIIPQKKAQHDQGRRHKQGGPDKIGQRIPQAESDGPVPHMDDVEYIIVKDILDERIRGPAVCDE